MYIYTSASLSAVYIAEWSSSREKITRQETLMREGRSHYVRISSPRCEYLMLAVCNSIRYFEVRCISKFIIIHRACV